MFVDFEDLGKSYEKSRKVIEREGIPRFFTRCLVELDDFVVEVSYCTVTSTSTATTTSLARRVFIKSIVLVLLCPKSILLY